MEGENVIEPGSLTEQLKRNFDNSPVAQQRATDRHNLAQAKIDKMKATTVAIKNMKGNVTGIPNRTTSHGVSTKTAMSSSLAQDLAGDAVYTEQNQSVANPFASDYFNAKWMGIDFGAVTNKNTDRLRGIDPFSKAADWEDIRRNEQSLSGALANEFTQFVSKTAINTIGGIVGGFYSLGAAAVNGVAGTGDGKGGSAANLLYDNSVNRGLDKATDWIDQNNSTFTSAKHRAEAPMMGFLSFEGFKDVSDAFSFTAGAVASELIIDAFSGGTGLAGLPGRLGRVAGKLGLVGRTAARAEEAIGLSNGVRKAGKLIEASEDLAKTMGKVDINDVVKLQELSRQTGIAVSDIQKYRKGLDTFSQAFKTGRGIVTGTFWEAGLEARHTKDELIADQTAKLDDFWGKQTEAWKTLNPDYYEKETKRINEAASVAGQWTFGLNTAALSISNHIQFPTIFGGAEKTSLNKMSGKLTTEGLANYKKAGGNVLDIIKSLGRGLKEPITEGLEEMTQAGINIGSKSYYESTLGTRTSSGEISHGVASVSDAVMKGVKSFGSESSIKEGLVGALVGAMGFPMMRRNSKGKLRPSLEGGVYGEYKEHKEQNRAIEDSIKDLNLDKFDTLLSYNKDNAIIASIDAKRGTIAELNGDEFEPARLQENVIFRHVHDRLNKGLESYMNNDVEEIKSMNLEDYKKRFNKEEDFTQEEKDTESNDFAKKVGIYADAYKKVYKGLRMDMINNNHISKKLFETLTYAVANEKILGERQKILTNKLLGNPNLDMTEEELSELAKFTGKYKDHENLIQDYIKEKLDDKQTILDKKVTELQRQKDYLEKSVGTKYAGFFTSQISSLEGEIQHESLKEDHKRDNTKIAALQKIISLKQDYSQVENQLEEAKLLKPEFNVSKSSNARKMIADKIGAEIKNNASEALDILRNKKDSSTQAEIERYIELKDKARVGITKNNESKGLSFLDTLNSDDIDLYKTLDELAHITKHQTTALEIATHLYGFNDSSEAYIQVANAQFSANLKNIQDDIFAGSRMMVMKDDEDAMAELASQMTVHINNVKSDLDEFGNMLSDEKKKEVLIKLDEAEDVVNSIERYLNNQDEKDDIAEATAKEEKEKAIDDVIQGIETKINAKKEADKEVDEEVKGDVDNAEFSNTKVLPFSSKNLHTVSLADPKHPQQIKLKEDVLSGKIKYNSAVVLRNKEENELTEGFRDYLNKLRIAPVYLSGKEKAIANPELLKKPFEDLEEDVKIYIAHAPAEVTIYDQQVKVSEGAQSFSIKEDTPVAGQFLYFAPTLKSKKGSLEKMAIRKEKVIQKYRRELAKLEQVPVGMKTADELIKIRQKELDEITSTLKGKAAAEGRAVVVKKFEKAIEDARLNDARDKTNDKDIMARFERDKAVLDERFTRAIESLKSQVELVAESKNDKVLFTFRQSMLYNKLTGNSEVKMRLGNINNGYLEKAAAGTEIGEYGITSEGGNDNFLIEDINTVQPTDFLFGNQLGEYKDLDGKVVKLNSGSTIEKTNAINARVYLKYQTINGQNIPIVLNRAKLGSNKAIYSEILFQLEQYIKKGKEGVITSLNDKSGNLDFLKGKSYEDFFKTFMDQSNHTNRDDNSLGTLTISKRDGSVMIGTMIIPVGSDIFTNKQKENELKNLRDVIDSMRFYLDVKSLRNNDGSFNNEFMKFILKQKLLNHDFNTINNNDKVFEREMNGETFNKSIQFHLLNSEVSDNKKSKNKPTYKDLGQSLHKIFNLETFRGNAAGMLDFTSVAYGMSGLVIARAVDKYKTMAGKKSKVKIVKEAFREIIEERKIALAELAKDFPTQSTPDLDVRKNPDIKSNEKFIDKFMKYLFKYGKEVGVESMFNKMAGHLQSEVTEEEIAKDVEEKMTMAPGIPSGPIEIPQEPAVKVSEGKSALELAQEAANDLVKSVEPTYLPMTSIVEKPKVTEQEEQSVADMLSPGQSDEYQSFGEDIQVTDETDFNEEHPEDSFGGLSIEEMVRREKGEDKSEPKKTTQLSRETRNWIEDNAATLTLKVERWMNKGTDKEKVKEILAGYKITDYNTFKAMLSILYKDTNKLKKMLTFAEKVFDTEDNDKLNCK